MMSGKTLDLDTLACEDMIFTDNYAEGAGIAIAPKRPLGRCELKPFNDWNDGQTATELNFKFYRQATNKIVGISLRAVRACIITA